MRENELVKVGSPHSHLFCLGLGSGSHSEAPFFYSKICCLSGFHPRLHAYSNTYKSSLRFFCRPQWDRNLFKKDFHISQYIFLRLYVICTNKCMKLPHFSINFNFNGLHWELENKYLTVTEAKMFYSI